MNKKSLGYRLQQLLILILHLILLGWMLYTLNNAGALSFTKVMLHFLGMSLMGAALIRGTAAWAKWHTQKEWRESGKVSEGQEQSP